MKTHRKSFALCLNNAGNEASLIVGKVYRVLRDARAEKDDLVRIIDESGEDYLYPQDQFALVAFPRTVELKLMAVAAAA